MIPIDLSGKVALVTGVTDNDSFAWHIAKALQAAGARLVFSCHPRVMDIVDSFLTREHDAESRLLPFGAGTLKVEKMIACDVSYDTMDDADEATKGDRRYKKYADFSVKGLIENMQPFGSIDVLVHSIAFSPEIKNRAVDTSRKAYLTALSISAYSLTSLMRAATPLMENRPGGAAAVALTYLGGDRVVPHYGGGMSTAKSALQIDAKQLAQNLGPKNIRVNCISAGPYASRAARNIGDIESMKKHAAEKSPLPRSITPEEVGATAAFLCCPLASAITGHVVYVDCGYNIMGV